MMHQGGGHTYNPCSQMVLVHNLSGDPHPGSIHSTWNVFADVQYSSSKIPIADVIAFFNSVCNMSGPKLLPIINDFDFPENDVRYVRQGAISERPNGGLD